MNSSDQGLSISGLLGASPGISPGAANSAEKSDNSLKKNEFSSVLGAEQQRRDGTSGQPMAETGGVGEKIPVDGLAVDSAQITLFGGTATGKPLPLQGEALPLTGAVAGSGIDVSVQAVTGAAGLGDGDTLTPAGEAVVGLADVSITGSDAVTTDTLDELAAGLGSGEGHPPVTSLTQPDPAEVAVTATVQPLVGSTSTEQTRQWWEARSNSLHASVQRAADGLPLSTGMDTVGGEEKRGLEFAQRVSLVASGQSASGTGGVPVPRNGEGQPSTALGNLAAGQLVMSEAATARTAMPGADSPVLDTNPVNSHSALSASAAGAGDRTPAATVPQTAVPVEVGRQGWSEQVMQRVMWMSAQNFSRAEIALDPPELGPLQVRVSAHGDQMTVAFTSAHGVVRDALDQGLPRLRDLMEQQGLNLADVDVSDQQPQRQAHDQDTESGLESGAGSARGDDAPEIAGSEAMSPADDARTMLVANTSLVDHFV